MFGRIWGAAKVVRSGLNTNVQLLKSTAPKNSINLSSIVQSKIQSTSILQKSIHTHSKGVVSSLFSLKTTKNNTYQRQSTRAFNTLQPRFRKHKKAQKGRVPVRVGGSTKGNYLAFGKYGLRILEGCRIHAKLLVSIYATLRKATKSFKGAKIFLRVFPDIPVSSKGSEARMGKGKGNFDYYACRVPKNKILIELSGGENDSIGVEVAKEAFRLCKYKLPVRSKFIVLNERTKQPEVLPPTTVPFKHAK